MLRNLVQIAGVKSLNEAKMLEDLGVDLIGFPLRLAFHTPDVTDDAARNIISELRDRSSAVLITYLSSAVEVSGFCSYLGVSTVQLHGEIKPSEVRVLKELRRDLTIIKSLIVRPEYSKNPGALAAWAAQYDPWVDAFITDTYDPKTTACGATGLTHDWEVSRIAAENLSRPLILAGGLRPGNVKDAIRQVRPAGVDSHTGVEDSDGSKSPELVAEFLEEAGKGFTGTTGVESDAS